jgi:hypothetical protein
VGAAARFGPVAAAIAPLTLASYQGCSITTTFSRTRSFSLYAPFPLQTNRWILLPLSLPVGGLLTWRPSRQRRDTATPTLWPQVGYERLQEEGETIMCGGGGESRVVRSLRGRVREIVVWQIAQI